MNLGRFLATNVQYLADIKLNISVEDSDFTENLLQGLFVIQVTKPSTENLLYGLVRYRGNQT